MTKKIFLLVLILIIHNSCTQQKKEVINVAVAANMQFAMQEIAQAFTTQYGIQCDLIISSSGKLTAQIIEGAPFNVFVSADMKYPNELYKRGLAVEKAKVYALGNLVLWSAIEGVEPSLDLLGNDEIRHIAIANPKMAPYGKAAIEILKNYNIFQTVEDKLVYGESVLQANQFIISHVAEVGFTSKSVVLSDRSKNIGKWIPLDDAKYSQIEQGAILIKQKDAEEEKGKLFFNFLFSESAKVILKKHGYSVVNSDI